jgi:hypothetical protein
LKTKCLQYIWLRITFRSQNVATHMLASFGRINHSTGILLW